MTIEDKRKALDEHCKKYLACNKCELYENNSKYGLCYSEELPDEVVEENYNIVFCEEHKHDNVEHPNHYETGKFECIEVMEEAIGTDAVKDFCVCNAFKYIYRHKRKNGKEDLEKARWYVNKYIELCNERE